MTSAPSRGPGEASAPPAPAPSPCTDGDARAQGDGTQRDGYGASLPGPRRALRLTHGNGGPSGTAGGVPGPGGSAACSPGLRSRPEGRLLQQPPGAVPPPRSDGRSHTWAGPEPGLRGGPWVPGQDSAGNRRGRPGEVAREGTEGQLWSCPPHRPVLLPTRAPTPGSSWEGRRKSPPWVMICSAQPSAHHPSLRLTCAGPGASTPPPRLGPSKELSLRSCSGHGEFTDRQWPVLWPSGDWKLDSWPLAAMSSWKTSWRWLLSLDLRKL